MKEYRCDCRGWSHYLIVSIGSVFFIVTLLVAVQLTDYRIGGVAVVALAYTLYFALEMINKRVVLEENAIMFCNIFGKQMRYEISEISQLVIINQHSSAYVSFKAAGDKVVIRKSQRGYDGVVKELFCRLNVTGYSRGGKMVIDINK